MQLIFQNNELDFDKEEKKFYFFERITCSICFRNIVLADRQFNFLPALDIRWPKPGVTMMPFAIRFTFLFFRIGLLF